MYQKNIKFLILRNRRKSPSMLRITSIIKRSHFVGLSGERQLHVDVVLR